MKTLLFIFAAGLTALVSGHPTPDEGEYGNHNQWRKTICEKKTDELFKDLEVCFQTEPKPIQEGVRKCTTELQPESNGDIIQFTNNACEDKSLFIKLDECFNGDEAFKELKKEKMLQTVIDCYTGILEKHGLPELMHYLEEHSEENH